jgi:hypothetical protein
VTTGEWNEEKKGIANDKEVIINGVCVMNQSSDFKANDEDEVESIVDPSNDESDKRLTIAEENDEDENDENEIKKTFIKKPVENSDDITVKKEVDEHSSWDY